MDGQLSVELSILFSETLFFKYDFWYSQEAAKDHDWLGMAVVLANVRAENVP